MKNYNSLHILTILTICFLYQTSFSQNEKKGLKRLLGVHVEEIQDKFDGSTTYRMKGNKVKIKGAVGSSVVKGAASLFSRSDVQLSIMTVRLQLEKYIPREGDAELAIILKVTIDDDARFWVMRGESLILLVDGERMAFSTDGDFNAESGFDSNLNFNSKTNARYKITRPELEKILNAKEVEFRVMQESIYEGQTEVRDKAQEGTHLEGSFSQKNFKAWKGFYNNYVSETREVIN